MNVHWKAQHPRPFVARLQHRVKRFPHFATELLDSRHARPVFADGFQGRVHGFVLERFQLLQHRTHAIGEDFTRQQQDRKTVDPGGRRAGCHVRGPRPHGSGHCQRLARKLRIRCGSMNRALLVLDQNVSNPASFLGNGFAELNVAMPENSQNMRDTFVNQVSNHGLTTGHALHLGGPRFRDCGRSLEFLFHNLLLQRYSTVSPRRHGVSQK